MQDFVVDTREKLLERIGQAGRVVICGADQRGIVLGGLMKEAEAQLICYAVNGKIPRPTLRGVPVMPISAVADKDVLALIAADEAAQMPAYGMLRALGFDNVAAISDSLYRALRGQVPVYLDFMCPGFAKCGTTTLQEVLKHNKSAFLPPAKETFFLQWYKQDGSTRVLRDRHYNNVRPGQKVGDIDPSHYNRARDAYEYFGGDLKLVFMLRNPADAEFSLIKMMNRFVYRPKYVEYYKRHGKFGQAMFMDYVSRELCAGKGGRRFEYARWIDEYLKYYPRENVKIVLMEDMLKKPTETMNEIQEFLGLDVMRFETLPRANEGKKVSRGWRSARVNLWVFGIDEYRKSRMNTLPMILFRKVLKPLIFAFTLVDNDEKISPEARRAVMDHYMPSIHRLEEIMGRSLEGAWY